MERWKVRCDAEYQREVSDFVRREVIYCVSHLIYELGSKLGDDSEYFEDLLNLCRQDQYINTFEYRCWECDEEWEEVDDDPTHENEYDLDEEDYVKECPKCKEEVVPTISSEETDPVEAYEHWIVTDWLAKKLEEHGCIVSHDFMGLTIWGRCCTGQAIAMDYVICEIYDEFNKDKVEEITARMEKEEQEKVSNG